MKFAKTQTTQGDRPRHLTAEGFLPNEVGVGFVSQKSDESVVADNIRMAERHGLGSYNVIGFVTIVDVARAKEFYRDKLGLRLVSEEPPFALVFDANGIMLRLGMGKERTPAVGTVLGWQVPDITVAVRDLERAGVQFERYEHVKQDSLGVWTAPGGAKVAWFKDPDGNILSVSEFPERRS